MVTKQQFSKDLRPETVVALENVSFTTRALPGVLEASESIDEVLLTGDNPDEETIDVARIMRCTPDTEERMAVLVAIPCRGWPCFRSGFGASDP